MRAASLFLFFALSLFGIALIRPDAVSPAFNFVQPSHAGPLLNQQFGPQADPPKTESGAVEHEVPVFIPEHPTLTFANDSEAEPDSESEPDGKSKPATENPDVQSKASEWPEFIGAKQLFGAVKEPAPLAARAIGTYTRGCLSGAVALPIDGPAWQEMRLSRNRNWGHPKLIALIEQFAKDAQKFDGWPGLLVGDIAQPRGGPMITGHASHQVGLDADFWLTPMPDRRLTAKEREDLQATSMLDNTGLAVDPKVFTDKQVALIKRAASYPEVERIFVHPAIKKALCQVAGTDRKWLVKCGPSTGTTIIFICVSNARRDLPAASRKLLRLAPTVAEKRSISGWRAWCRQKHRLRRRRQSALLQRRRSRRSCSRSYLRNAKLFWGPNRTRSRSREMR